MLTLRKQKSSDKLPNFIPQETRKRTNETPINKRKGENIKD